MKVAPQSRVRTAVLYRLVELACRKNHTGNAGSCGSARASVELNLSDVALALGCTVRIVRYWLAHLCKRGIVRRIDARGGRGRGLELELTWHRSGRAWQLSAETRKSPYPPSERRKDPDLQSTWRATPRCFAKLAGTPSGQRRSRFARHP